MNANQNINNAWSKAFPNESAKPSRKEVNMSRKVLLRIFIPASVLAVVLLATLVVTSTSAPAPISGETMTKEQLAGSDWIERHPSVVRSANYYTGSDWIERHPSVVRPENYYNGSDWIERHPSVVRPENYYTGSDWIERHPQNPYVGSDWIERHPSQPTR